MMEFTCEYCGYRGGTDLIEARDGVLACRDTACCDEREEKAHWDRIRELRRRRREGDELTEAEAQELAEAT